MVFRQEEWLIQTTPFTWNFVPNWLRSFENYNFQSIFACSASAEIPSENKLLSLIGTLLRAFREPKMNSVRCPKPLQGGSKTLNGRFSYKSALISKTICYKISLCESVSNKVARHSLAYLTVQKWLLIGVLFYLKFWLKLTHGRTSSKCRFPIDIFAGSASAVTPGEKGQLTRTKWPFFVQNLNNNLR